MTSGHSPVPPELELEELLDELEELLDELEELLEELDEELLDDELPLPTGPKLM